MTNTNQHDTANTSAPAQDTTFVDVEVIAPDTTVNSTPVQAPALVQAQTNEHTKTPIAEAIHTALMTTENIDDSQFEGAGLEEVDSKSLTIPRIVILQAQSPNVIEAMQSGNTRLRPGTFYNTVTDEVFTTFDFIPCHLRRKVIFYHPDTRGFAAAYPFRDVEKGNVPNIAVSNEDHCYKMQDPNTGKIFDGYETNLHYVLAKDTEGNWSPAILSLSKTQLKQSKKLSTLFAFSKAKKEDGTLYTPPSWANVYNGAIIQESNDKGAWFSWKFKAAGQTPAELKAMAISLYKTVQDMDTSIEMQVLPDDVAPNEYQHQPSYNQQGAYQGYQGGYNQQQNNYQQNAAYQGYNQQSGYQQAQQSNYQNNGGYQNQQGSFEAYRQQANNGYQNQQGGYQAQAQNNGNAQQQPNNVQAYQSYINAQNNK